MLLPAAAPCGLRDALAEARTGEVVHVGRSSLALSLRTRSGSQLVVVDTVGADPLPCAVLAPGAVPTALAQPGDRVTVVPGAGGPTLRLRGGDLQVVRWWQPPRVPTCPPVTAGELRRLLCAHLTDAEHLPSALDEAARLLLAGAADRAGQVLAGLLGAGPGSTPAADDAVAGLLLAARAFAHDEHAAAVATSTAALVADTAPARTTPLSATLLRHTAFGEATPSVVAMLRRPTSSTVTAVLRLGGTSGTATAAGVLTLLDRLPTPAQEAA